MSWLMRTHCGTTPGTGTGGAPTDTLRALPPREGGTVAKPSLSGSAGDCAVEEEAGESRGESESSRGATGEDTGVAAAAASAAADCAAAIASALERAVACTNRSLK